MLRREALWMEGEKEKNARAEMEKMQKWQPKM